MKDKFISKYWGYLFLLVPIALQMIFFYLPTIRGVIFSFTNWTGLTDNYDFIGFKNYTAIFSDPKLIKTIKFTIIFTLGMILGQVSLGILVARALNAKLKTSNFFRGIFFFPAVCNCYNWDDF
jgi:raffinose/stachyose/melibiose transport system permease protein